MHDLVIKGGTVVDGRHDLEAPRGIAIEAGRVAEVASEIATDKARDTFGATGKLVVPGIVDTEVHIPSGSGPTTAHRQLVRAGVTTALDFADFCRVLADLSARCSCQHDDGHANQQIHRHILSAPPAARESRQSRFPPPIAAHGDA